MVDHKKAKEQFERLLTIMDELRIKCPWDRKQTLETLRHLTLEEVYELSDAILKNDAQELKNELGDLFLHLVFYSKIASEELGFDVSDVLENICEKLIHRHPHIYGQDSISSEEDVKSNWEKLKLKEGKNSVLDGVPTSLPSLIKAYRIQEKVKGVGFEFENFEQVASKVWEEIQEFLQEQNPKNKINEFGDILFALVNFARYHGINPDDALAQTNQKFILRFKQMERLAQERGLTLHELPLEQQDKLWDEVKKNS